MVQVRWLKEAKLDLQGIYNFIARDSRKYARLQVERLKERTQILYTHPQSGRIVPEMGDENIRELILGNYRIVYRILSINLIHILLVHHSARDLKRRLNE